MGSTIISLRIIILLITLSGKQLNRQITKGGQWLFSWTWLMTRHILSKTNLLLSLTTNKMYLQLLYMNSMRTKPLFLTQSRSPQMIKRELKPLLTVILIKQKNCLTLWIWLWSLKMTQPFKSQSQTIQISLMELEINQVLRTLTSLITASLMTSMTT